MKRTKIKHVKPQLAPGDPVQSGIRGESTKNKIKAAINYSQQFYYPEGRAFKCPYCEEKLKTTLLWNNHKRLGHLCGRFSCPECATSFPLLKELIGHMYDTNHDDDGKTLVRCGGGYGRMGQYKSGSVGCVLYFDIEFSSEHYVKCCAEKIEKKNQSYMDINISNITISGIGASMPAEVKALRTVPRARLPSATADTRETVQPTLPT